MGITRKENNYLLLVQAFELSLIMLTYFQFNVIDKKLSNTCAEVEELLTDCSSKKKIQTHCLFLPEATLM